MYFIMEGQIYFTIKKSVHLLRSDLRYWLINKHIYHIEFYHNNIQKG